MFEGYVAGSCAKDETVKVRAKFHWIVWLKFYISSITMGAISAFCWLVAWQMYIDNEPEMAIGTIIFGGLFLIYPLYLFLKLELTEMASTNRRVVYKTGIISVETAEIKIDKIESIQIVQSFWGRVLGYGDICFSGTGTAKVYFYYVDNPWRIKPQIEEAIDDSLKIFHNKNSDNA